MFVLFMFFFCFFQIVARCEMTQRFKFKLHCQVIYQVRDLALQAHCGVLMFRSNVA